MRGNYDSEFCVKGLKTPTGRLNIEVVNLQEFKELIDRAKHEADQLQETINRLSCFELNIDFNIGKDITSE